MVTAGLTGNYGMGKSSVLKLFKELGAFTLDSDSIVAELLGEKKVVRAVGEILGPAALRPDGNLDKKAVAEKIFRDPASREALQAFIHPLVLKTVKSRIRAAKSRTRVAVIEVPLLYEGGYQEMFEKVITVYTTRQTALSRLKAKGIRKDEAVARMRAQLPIGEKKKKADFAINNNGAPDKTRKQVEKVYTSLLGLDLRGRPRRRS